MSALGHVDPSRGEDAVNRKQARCRWFRRRKGNPRRDGVDGTPFDAKVWFIPRMTNRIHIPPKDPSPLAQGIGLFR